MGTNKSYVQDYFSYNIALNKIVHNFVVKEHTQSTYIVIAFYSRNVRVIFINMLMAYNRMALMGEHG